MATRALLYRRPSEPLDSFGQARLANLFGSAAPASARAALHLAHSSKRPRSDPDHAAARHARARPRISRSVTAAGLPRASAVCRRPRRFCPAPWCRCAAFRTGSCIAPASAARCGRRCATAASEILCVAGGAEHIERRVHDYLKREARRDLQKSAQAYAQALGVRVKRLSIRDQSSRWGSCTSAGSLSFSWRLILAPPLRARLSRRPRGRASRRDEPFGAVLAGGRQGLRPRRARQGLARHLTATTCIATASRIELAGPDAVAV